MKTFNLEYWNSNFFSWKRNSNSICLSTLQTMFMVPTGEDGIQDSRHCHFNLLFSLSFTFSCLPDWFLFPLLVLSQTLSLISARQWPVPKWPMHHFFAEIEAFYSAPNLSGLTCLSQFQRHLVNKVTSYTIQLNYQHPSKNVIYCT